MNEILLFFGNVPVELIASWVTIISLPIAVPAYFIQRYYDEHSEKKRATNNLCRELQDTLEGLNMKLHKEDLISFKVPNGKTFFHINRTLNHDFYDSLVFSGKINFLQPELQQSVQNVFNQIKMHNEYTDFIRKNIEKHPNNIFPKYMYKYFEWLQNNETKLLNVIPIIIKKLEKKE